MLNTIFWDLGGVVLTNGWDRAARARACGRFALDCDDFQDRHEQVVSEFETGGMDLDTYLERTVFFEPRQFGQADFKAFMFAQSREDTVMLDLVRWRKAVGGKETVALNDKVLLGQTKSADHPALAADLLEKVTEMTGDNWREKAEEMEEILRDAMPT